MSSTTNDTPLIRLHISPFNASLYPTIIAPSLRPLVSTPSYHTIQSDPSKSYGYIDLPKPEADKLRQKLHGATLRGSKMSIEVAKPDGRKRLLAEIEEASTADPDQAGDAQRSSKKKKVKARKSKGEIPGWEMPDGRSVKRGWTEEANKVDSKKKGKKREKSKFTAGKEVLFKTHLPVKSLAIAAEDAQKEKKDRKERKLRDKRVRGVVVHEFEKNTQYPSFLRQEARSDDKGVAAEYVDGKGWVDENGNVVEAVVVKQKREDRLAAMPQNEIEIRDEEEEPRRKRKREEPVPVVMDETEEAPAQDEQTKQKLANFDKMLEDDSDSDEHFNDADETNHDEEVSDMEDEESDEDEDEDEESDEESDENEGDVELQTEQDAQQDDAATASEELLALESEQESSDDSSDSDSDDGSDSASSSDASEGASMDENIPTQPASTTLDMPDADPLATPPPESKEIHPLEALYKRPKPDGTPKPAAIQTSFSFGFTNDDASDTASNIDGQDTNEYYDQVDTEVPHTPFSAEDYRGRRSRSAAPTPDTAAIGKRFSFSAPNDHTADYEDYAEEEYQDDMVGVNYMPVATRKTFTEDDAAETGDGSQESGFAKWFWENRGDSNRAWKKRRREALKVNRQRENRRIGRKIV